MADPRFFHRAGPFSLGELAQKIGAELGRDADASLMIRDVAPLDQAQSDNIAYFSDKRYAVAFQTARAGACITTAKLAALVPAGIGLLIVADAPRGYIRAAQLFYPPAPRQVEIHRSAVIDPSARLAEGVSVGPGAVIGPAVELGRDVTIGANAVIGAGVVIGNGSSIGPNGSIGYALIGDRVLIHAGVCVGQDGFGYASSAAGPEKIPQLGRVIIQDDVEIGANTTIDRGAGPDTVIGQGTKIDNLVQIGHNVRIGRYCVLAAHTGISGSSVVGDFVAMGGRVGLADHVTVGNGAQIAAAAGVMRDIPAGEVHAGIPARPIREFMREVAAVTRLAAKGKGAKE